MNKSMEIFEDSFIVRCFQSTSFCLTSAEDNKFPPSGWSPPSILGFWSRLVIRKLVKFEKGTPYDFYQKMAKIDKFEKGTPHAFL